VYHDDTASNVTGREEETCDVASKIAEWIRNSYGVTRVTAPLGPAGLHLPVACVLCPSTSRREELCTSSGTRKSACPVPSVRSPWGIVKEQQAMGKAVWSLWAPVPVALRRKSFACLCRVVYGSGRVVFGDLLILC
jgi:hypothetical protein